MIRCKLGFHGTYNNTFTKKIPGLKYRIWVTQKICNYCHEIISEEEGPPSTFDFEDE